MFSEASPSFSGNSYSALGAAGLASVQPYFLLIAALGIMVGGGTALKMTKAKASGNMDEYHRILNSYIPQNVYFGTVIAIVLFVFAKPLVYMGSGFQSAYAQN
jgi:Na+-driven multidrug efflux pump